MGRESTAQPPGGRARNSGSPRARTGRHDLHGNVPDECAVALLLIDVINAMDFEGGAAFAARAGPAARSIALLKARASAAGIPAVYANDNFGRWTSDFRQVVEHCRVARNGGAITQLLEPQPGDYFVLKPKHSAFFATTLDTLLQYLGARTLILVGFAADICVLFTAHEAYLRDYRVVVPRDCTTSRSDEAGERTMRHLEEVLEADTTVSSDLALEPLLARSDDGDD